VNGWVPVGFGEKARVRVPETGGYIELPKPAGPAVNWPTAVALSDDGRVVGGHVLVGGRGAVPLVWNCS
jgi:hypothetical protein